MVLANQETRAEGPPTLAIGGDDWAFLFVGCGGTFWAATPYLSQIYQRCRPGAALFVDPDEITGANLTRQWCGEVREMLDDIMYDLPGRTSTKAKLAALSVTLRSGADAPELVAWHRKTFQDALQDYSPNGVMAQLGSRKLVVFVNVDNDEARLAVRDWVRERLPFAAVIVSGCDTDHGQVYYGAWEAGRPLHDFFELHPDINTDTPRPTHGGCAAQPSQSIFSNAITGQFLGLAFEDVYRLVEIGAELGDGKWGTLREFYWRGVSHQTAFTAWASTLVPCTKISVEEEVT